MTIDQLELESYEDRHLFGDIYETILKEIHTKDSGEFYTPRAVIDFMAEMIEPKLGEKIADLACGTGGFLASSLKILEKQIVTVEDQIEYANSIYGIEKKSISLHVMCNQYDT